MIHEQKKYQQRERDCYKHQREILELEDTITEFLKLLGGFNRRLEEERISKLKEEII